MRPSPDDPEVLVPRVAPDDLGPLFAPIQIPEDTRRRALEEIAPRVTRLEEQVLAALIHGPATADEIAARVGEDRLSIRPRCTALHQRGKITDSGERRPNASGKNAIVWALRGPR